jgi:hypothetical protein
MNLFGLSMPRENHEETDSGWNEKDDAESPTHRTRTSPSPECPAYNHSRVDQEGDNTACSRQKIQHRQTYQSNVAFSRLRAASIIETNNSS